jgi:hypothetical protein
MGEGQYQFCGAVADPAGRAWCLGQVRSGLPVEFVTQDVQVGRVVQVQAYADVIGADQHVTGDAPQITVVLPGVIPLRPWCCPGG